MIHLEKIRPTLTEKPRRKRTKIVAAVGVLIVFASIIGLYAYSYHIVNDALKVSVKTIKVDHVSIEGYSLSPPSIDIKIVFILNNPTSVSVAIESVSIDVFVDASSAGVITAGPLDLPAKGKTTFEGILRFTEEQLQIVEKEQYTMSMNGKIVGSASCLFVTITHEYPVNIEETVTKSYD